MKVGVIREKMYHWRKALESGEMYPIFDAYLEMLEVSDTEFLKLKPDESSRFNLLFADLRIASGNHVSEGVKKQGLPPFEDVTPEVPKEVTQYLLSEVGPNGILTLGVFEDEVKAKEGINVPGEGWSDMTAGIGWVLHETRSNRRAFYYMIVPMILNKVYSNHPLDDPSE